METRRVPLVVALSAALGASLLPSTALAENEISGRVSTTFAGPTSGLYATGATNVLVEGEIGYGHHLMPFGPMRLWLEGDYMVAHRSDRAFSLQGSLFLQRLTVGARLAFALERAPWLVPHIRLGVGAAVGQLTLNGNIRAADWEAAFAGHALLGLELLIPRKFLREVRGRGFTAGIVIDAGLAFATPLAFAPVPHQDEDTVHAPITAARFGSVDLTAVVLRTGVVLRF